MVVRSLSVGIPEECAQDAFAQALVSWRRDGVPRNPGAWLATAAHFNDFGQGTENVKP
jgi:predicted RNA polymerase sigma factor